MRSIKVLLLFIAAFILAWIIIATFTQAPFKQPVSAVILWYSTPAWPIFWYVAGAVAAGILIGVLCMLSPLISAWIKLADAHKKIRQHEANSVSAPAAADASNTAHDHDSLP
jgi:uncharacterized membrane protein YciS (DUF1049 family)